MSTVTTRPYPTPLLIKKVAPAAYDAMIALDDAAAAGPIEAPLLELVRLRASLLNGCAYCIDMHTKDARRAGESDERLHLVSVWREAPNFSDRERAAFALTEAVTLVADGHVPDEAWQAAAAEFSEEELAQLLWAIVTINAWNRIAISTRLEPGRYRPS